MKFALASRRVVLPDGVRPATVVVENGRIVEVREGVNQGAANLGGIPIEDVGNLVIAPGVVDAHVHINEPGHTEWEGFETATRAAAAGGVTTLVDMPLNSVPVTTTVAALEAKRKAAAGKCRVDVGFYGGVVPDNVAEVELLLKAGVLGMKAFLCHSGLDEFPNAQLADLQAAATILKKYDRPLLVHAELLNSPVPQPKIANRYADYLATRPPQWETDAIQMLIELCRTTGCRVHIVHLANSDALQLIKAAKDSSLPLTVETCPHYLHFAADATESIDDGSESLEVVELVMELESEFDFSIPDLAAEHFQLTGKGIPDGDTRFKCAPPIRERRHQERLWFALQMGLIDTIGSDHSPCPPEMKHLESGNFMAAWGGIASLQLTLPIVWTGARSRDIKLHKVFQWLATNPAQLVGLQNRKGRIVAGFDADLILFDPEANWTVSGQQLHHRHKLTPYDGEELFGQVQRTYLRGEIVFLAPEFVGEPMARLLSMER
ncbi:MAG TPA: amidohydrolase family protein [Pirellulales bacterium]|jgi:allantoinase